MVDRAIELAGSAAEAPSLTLLELEIGGKRLAVDAAAVIEVAQAVAISAVPSGPPILEGVINYRGKVVPVLDARSRLGVPARPLSPDEHLIVADASGRQVAFRVDRAVALRSVDPGAVEDARASVPEAGLSAGVVKLPDGLRFIWDLARFLGPGEGEAVDAAVATRAREAS